MPLFIIPLRLLDIGCGWGTLVAYAAKNFGCDATGVTLARNQTQFGTERIAKNGASFFFFFLTRILIMLLYRFHQTRPVFYAVTIGKFLPVPNTTRLSVLRWLRWVIILLID
jgi:cyclopropane fatty-acyl-phospholipid synthase-like methyltransferase